MNEIEVRLLSSHRPTPLISIDVGSEWQVDGVRKWKEIPKTDTISELKSTLKGWYGIPTDEQHWYHDCYNVHQTTYTKEVDDSIKVGSLRKRKFAVIIEPPRSLTHSAFMRLLPHINGDKRQELLTLLKSIPTDQLDVASIRETTMIPPKSIDVTIRNHTRGSVVPVTHITVDDQIYIPYQFDPTTKLVKFRSKYSYQYSAASDEYVQEMKKANQQCETELVHCKKLLHDLPIALANSEKKLSEERKALHEKVPGVEFADLGVLLHEQDVIMAEIKNQEERLAQLKPIPFDKSKFTIYEFHSEIRRSD